MNGGSVRSVSPAVGRPQHASRPPRWPLLMVVAVALAMAALPGLTDLASDPDIGVLAGCSSPTPQLAVAVLDVSSSVIDSGGADPSGRSFDEIVLVADLMRQTPCSDDDRFGAIIFANQSVEIPPTPVSSHSVIAATMKRPPEDEIGGGTEIRPALLAVSAMIERHPGHEVTVVVLSDMATDEDLDDALAALEAQVHLVALGTHNPTFDRHFDSIASLDGTKRGAIGSAIVNALNEGRQA